MGQKLRLAAGQQHNPEPALLRFGQHRASDLHLPPTAGGVLDLQRPAAAQLDAIMEDRARRQAVGAEAGTPLRDSTTAGLR